MIVTSFTVALHILNRNLIIMMTLQTTKIIISLCILRQLHKESQLLKWEIKRKDHLKQKKTYSF